LTTVRKGWRIANCKSGIPNQPCLRAKCSAARTSV
jgi:hypothetical protein